MFGSIFRSAVSLHDALLPGVDRHLCAISKMQFAQDVADMSLHRVFTDDQFLGDLAVGETVGDQLEHIQFALGQFGEERLVLASFTAQVLQDARGHARMQCHLPLHRPMQNLDQFLHLHVF